MTTKQKEWKREEVVALRKIFGNNSNDTVARALNRTRDSVKHKAQRLGLKKTKRYMRSLRKQ